MPRVVPRGLTWPDGAWVASPKARVVCNCRTPNEPAKVFFAQAFGNRHLHRYCPEDVIPDARLYFLTVKDGLTNESDRRSAELIGVRLAC